MLFSIGLNGVKKMRGIRFFEKSSTPLAVWLPSTGTFSNQFLEGMKQIYELEPFIDVRMIKPGESACIPHTKIERNYWPPLGVECDILPISILPTKN